MRLSCPLESRSDFWDNRHAVNTSKLLVSSLLFLSLAAAGCEKSTDLGHMRDETVSIVKLHARDIEVLQRNADALTARWQTAGADAPGGSDAARYLNEARTSLGQLRTAVKDAEPTLTTAVTAGDLEQVRKTSDELIEKLDTLEEGVHANLAAVDTLLMTVENGPSATPPPAAQTDTHDGPSAPGGDAGSAAAPTTPPAAPSAPAPQ
ncbi:hypothetical protein BH11MYX3_BH11MYX3_42310 [soil metagenome]